jgi:hypothetical protein
LRLYPEGNVLDYNVSATTETVAEAREIDLEEDDVAVAVGASDIGLRRLEASLNPFSVNVTDDVDGDGRLDVGSDAEAEVTDLDLSAVNDLQPEGFQLRDASMTLSLSTNLEADVDVYAALAGRAPSGETVYLGGRGSYAVQADSIAEDFAGLSADQLIKMPLSGRTDLVLDEDNSNISDFLSAIPEQVRFVGKALLGADGGRAVIEQPVTLDASLNLDVPLALQGTAALTPNVDADLTGLPDLTGEAQTVQVKEADLILDYANGLPIGFGARLDVLDAAGDLLLTLPASGGGPLRIERAPSSDDGFASGVHEDTAVVSITADQLEQMSEAGQQIDVQLTVEAPDDRAARLNSTDSLRIALEGRFNVNVEAGDDQ